MHKYFPIPYRFFAVIVQIVFSTMFAFSCFTVSINEVPLKNSKDVGKCIIQTRKKKTL